MIMDKCYDPSFREMNYKHRWYKHGNIIIFGKEWPITIVAKAYKGQNISDLQRCAFANFENKWASLISHCENVIFQYVISDFTDEPYDKPESIYALSTCVFPRTLFFKRDGQVVLLFDCVWDSEHGIGVELLPEVKIGSQDIFL